MILESLWSVLLAYAVDSADAKAQLCNLVFAALATGLVFFRYRILASRQYLKLAARIGIPNLV